VVSSVQVLLLIVSPRAWYTSCLWPPPPLPCPAWLDPAKHEAPYCVIFFSLLLLLLLSLWYNSQSYQCPVSVPIRGLARTACFYRFTNNGAAAVLYSGPFAAGSIIYDDIFTQERKRFVLFAGSVSNEQGGSSSSSSSSSFFNDAFSASQTI
jgi:hypothetical protein